MNLQTVEISYVSDKLVMEHLPRTIYPILREKCHYLFMQCNIFLVSHISKIWQTCKIFVMLYSEPWDNKCILYRLRNFVETIEIITASFPQIVNYGNDNSFGQLFFFEHNSFNFGRQDIYWQIFYDFCKCLYSL